MKQLKDNGIKEVIRLVKNELKGYSKTNHTHSNYLPKLSPIIENGLYWKSNNNGKRNLIHLFQSNNSDGDGCGLSSDGLVVIHAGKMSNISKYILNSPDDTDNIRLTTPNTEDVIISSDSNIRFYVNTQSGNKESFKGSYIDKNTGVYMGTANKAIYDDSGYNIKDTYIKKIKKGTDTNFILNLRNFHYKDLLISEKLNITIKVKDIFSSNNRYIEIIKNILIRDENLVLLNNVTIPYIDPGLVILRCEIEDLTKDRLFYVIEKFVPLYHMHRYYLNIYSIGNYSLESY